MSTFRELTASLQVSLKKTFISSDISLAQIAFWCKIFINKYNSAKLGIIESGRYLSIFTNVPVTSDTTSTNPNYIAGRKYFILPSNILDIKDDGGIDYISYTDFDQACQPSFAGVVFTRTTPTKARLRYWTPYETPKPNNPYFYLVNNIVYLLGLECVNISGLEIGLYTAFDPFAECSVDEDMQLDPALEVDIYKNVLELGRLTALIPIDRINDGSDNPDKAAPTQRFVSLNDQQPQPTPSE